jgi:hypothetical protein
MPQFRMPVSVVRLHPLLGRDRRLFQGPARLQLVGIFRVKVYVRIVGQQSSKPRRHDAEQAFVTHGVLAVVRADEENTAS